MEYYVSMENPLQTFSLELTLTLSYQSFHTNNSLLWITSLFWLRPPFIKPHFRAELSLLFRLILQNTGLRKQL